MPFSLSVSVSFVGAGISFPGSSSPIANRGDRTQDLNQQDPNGETNIPQGFVILAFLAIFLAQVGINFLHAVRTGRRRRRLLEMQFPQSLPQQDPGRNRTLNREPGTDTTPSEEVARNDAEESPFTRNALGDG